MSTGSLRRILTMWTAIGLTLCTKVTIVCSKPYSLKEIQSERIQKTQSHLLVSSVFPLNPSMPNCKIKRSTLSNVSVRIWRSWQTCLMTNMSTNSWAVSFWLNTVNFSKEDTSIEKTICHSSNDFGYCPYKHGLFGLALQSMESLCCFTICLMEI